MLKNSKQQEKPFTDPDFNQQALAEFMDMEPSECSLDNIATKCGFKNTSAFNTAFKFAFGVLPADYLNSVSQMFKKTKKPFFSTFTKIFFSMWTFLLTS